jgi:transcriptional regulator with XRE-family HTH domain
MEHHSLAGMPPGDEQIYGMPSTSPAAAQHELVIRLRQRRTERSLSMREVSSHLHFTANYYSAVENGKTLLAAEKLTALLRFLEYGPAEAAELQALWDLARQPRWTADYSNIIDDELAHYFGLEYAASRIRTYESSLIPGLLQIRDYTLALFVDDPGTASIMTQKRLELRQHRQDRLFGDDPLVLEAVVSQAAIMQQRGGPRVLAAQLSHLIDLAERLADTLTIRVIPFEASPRGMIGASTLHLLEFPSSHMPVLAWRDLIATAGLGLTDDPELLDLLIVNYDRAALSALDRVASLDLIRHHAELLDSGES